MTGELTDDVGADRPGQEGLGAASESPPEAIRATYDEWVASGAYDADVAGWGYQVPERLASLIVGDIGHSTRRPVLDAGCGTGRGGVALRSIGIERVVGGDFSETSLTEARERNVYDEVVHLDLNQPLAFDDETFAAVVSAGVFSYVTNAGPALTELLRVVEHGGLVAFSQRTDLWETRSFDSVLDALGHAELCDVDVSDPIPYLPGHPDFGDDVGVRLVQLRRSDVSISRRAV